MSNISTIIIWLLISYLIGNICPSIILGKINGVDIRNKGSGNAGTTNVLRTMGKKYAVVTLIIDVLKGTLAVYLAYRFATPHIAMFAAVGVFAGHIWPLFFGFRGGKGVATSFGAILGISLNLSFYLFMLVLIGIIIHRKMSLASITAALLSPFITYFIKPEFTPFILFMAVILIFKHRENIKRLIDGNEPRLFEKMNNEE